MNLDVSLLDLLPTDTSGEGLCLHTCGSKTCEWTCKITLIQQ